MRTASLRRSVAGLALGLRFWRLSLRTLAAYRGDLALSLFSALLFHFEALGVIWALLHHFPRLGGWRLPEVALMYSIFLMGHAIATAFGTALLRVPELVREGSFDRFLIRPLPPLFQVVTLPSRGALSSAVLAAGLATAALPAAPVEWGPAAVAVLAAGVAGSAAIQAAFTLLAAATAFWLLAADDLRELLIDLITEFGRYPTHIFGHALQWLLHLLPAGFIAYYPAAWLLGREGALLPAWAGATLSPLAAGLWLWLGLRAWQAGLRRYSSTGS